MKNRVGIVQYPDIMPDEIMALSAEELSRNRIRPLVSMHDRSVDNVTQNHNNMADIT